MKKTNALFTLGLLVLFVLFACAPPTTGTKDGITINVTKPASDKWKYAISTAGSSNITKVVFTLTVSGCEATSIPVGWKKGPVNGGIQVESAAGAGSLNVTITCDAKDGPNYVDVHDLGGVAITVGPISGPT